MKTKTLCNTHRKLAGFYSKTLRTATVAHKCDVDGCQEVKGVLASDTWKMSPNGASNKLSMGDV